MNTSTVVPRFTPRSPRRLVMNPSPEATWKLPSVPIKISGVRPQGTL
jgi:hypothetical protein